MPKYVGQSYQRKEDYRLLTGTGNFVADMKKFNMLEVSFVQSTHAHAKIKSIDTSEAEKMDGVLAVLTGEDIEGEIDPLPALNEFILPESMKEKINFDVKPCVEEILAKDRVIYSGQKVAVVLAENRYIAEDAAALVQIEYETLQATTDPFESMKEDALPIHANMENNIQANFHFSIGDVNKAFESAYDTFTTRIKIPRISGNPIETRGMLAKYEKHNNQLTMWTSTQLPYIVRRYLSNMLDLAENNVHVIAPDVGGAFGVKAAVFPEEILIGYLAKKFERPVKWIEDRMEHLTGSRHSRDQYHDIKVAFTKDGLITGIKNKLVVDCGVYSPHFLVGAYNAATHIPGTFKIKNYEITGKCVLTNKAPYVSYRGAGRPEGTFVMDRIVFHIAQRLHLNQAEVMRRNMVQPEEMPYDTGMYYSDGGRVIYDSGDYPQLLEKALEIADYDNLRKKQEQWKSEEKYMGIGVSTYIEATGAGPFEGALVRLDATGRIIVHGGSTAMGQGLETAFSQISADVFGLSPEQITVKIGDTGLLPHGRGSYGSRSAIVGGSAIKEASKKLRKKLFSAAGKLLEVNVKDLQMADGKIYSHEYPDKCMTLQELAIAAQPGPNNKIPTGTETGIEASSYFVPPSVTYSSGVHIAIVEVDKETGFIDILDYVLVHDCGKVLNPKLVEGQMQGGVAQGIGEAIYEEIVYDRIGQMVTGTFMDYLLPTAMEIPTANMGHLEIPATTNKLGLRGAGEGGILSSPGAIVNAVNDALKSLNVYIDEPSVNPSRVWQIIQHAEQEKNIEKNTILN